MFSLFKKTSWKIEGKALEFFRQVFLQLPVEYQFLSAGLNKGLYRRILVNHAMGEHCYSVSFDPSQSNKSMIYGMQFDLEGIIIIQEGQAYPLNITVDDGLWIAFEIPKNILDFNNFRVDLSSFRETKSRFSADTKIEKLVAGLVCKQLELTNLAEIEVDGKLYYQIKDLENGNYIAIDNHGKVYGLIHNQYKIELINKSVKQFVVDVNNGIFNFDKYIDKQNA